jgi:hypothetical protein
MKQQAILRTAGMLLLLFGIVSSSEANQQPRVFVFTDINIDSGDPDDRQSLVHLLWYANELDIRGIVPDRWNAGGMEACKMAVDAYAEDYETFGLSAKGFPKAESLRGLLARDLDHAMQLFQAEAAGSSPEAPLYVLIWGNMRYVGRALRGAPELSKNIRLITIGTGWMYPDHERHAPAGWPRAAPCALRNWNGDGRDEIREDPRFRELWWLEINWTYNGMFSGQEPPRFLDELSGFGALGRHMVDVTRNHSWARYFRAGDTPSVLYVIDPRGNLDDPTKSSWAGRFKRPFPDERPSYYTDHNGAVQWDYANPCRTWDQHPAFYAHAVSTLEKERPGMYVALLEKLKSVYQR